MDPAPAKLPDLREATPDPAAADARKLDRAVPPQERAELQAAQQDARRRADEAATAPPAGMTPDEARKAELARYWSEQPHYVDDAGTVYLATFDPRSGDLTTDRANAASEQVLRPSARRELDERRRSFDSRISELRHDGSRGGRDVSAHVEALTAEQYAGHPLEPGSDGHVYRVTHDPATGTVTREIQPDEVSVHYRNVLHLDGGVTEHTITGGDLPDERGSDTTLVTRRVDPTGTLVGTTTTRDRLDEFDGRTTRSVQQVDTDPSGAPLRSMSHQTSRNGDTVASSAEDVQFEGGLPTSQLKRVTLDGPADFLDARTITTFTGDGLVDAVSTVSDARHSATDDDGNVGTISSRTISSASSGGDGLRFDENGTPLNAVVTGHTTNDYRVVDRDGGEDGGPMETVLRQRGAIGSDGTVAWDDASQQVDRFDASGRLVTSNHFRFDASQLDGDGYPRAGAAPVEDVSRRVDERGFFERNDPSYVAGIGLAALGTVLVLIPTGVTQVVGGGMMVAGSGLLLRKDLPAFIEDPSLDTGLAVGLDVLTAVGGLGAVANVTAAGSRMAIATTQVLANPMVRAAGYGALAYDGGQYAHAVATGQFESAADAMLHGAVFVAAGTSFAVSHATRRSVTTSIPAPPGAARQSGPVKAKAPMGASRPVPVPPSGLDSEREREAHETQARPGARPRDGSDQTR